MCPFEYIGKHYSAFMTMLIPSLIALAVGFIAFQQFLLAKEKFQLDLFEKRFAVFRGVELFLFELRINRKFTTDIFLKFNSDTQTASFIFDEDIKNYVDEVRSKGRDLRYLFECMKDMPAGDERHKMFVEAEAILNELEQMESFLPVKFSPYLKFRKWKHGLIWEIK